VNTLPAHFVTLPNYGPRVSNINAPNVENGSPNILVQNQIFLFAPHAPTVVHPTHIPRVSNGSVLPAVHVGKKIYANYRLIHVEVFPVAKRRHK
jgi:hypothetical protein